MFEAHPLGPLPEAFKDPRYAQPWLTKLKATLTPEEMREDLVLTCAPQGEEYRETVIRW